nr:twin-arginine translocase subunit TatC [Bacillota bacterium]
MAEERPSVAERDEADGAPRQDAEAGAADDGSHFAGVRSRLAEVRARLIRAGLAWLAAAAGVYAAAPRLIEHMVAPLPQGEELFYLSPAEAFVSRVKLALAGGFTLSVPVLLYQLVRLLAPLLSPGARRAALRAIPAATALFVAGIALGYFGLVPVALRFLLGFAGPDLVPMLSLSAYIRFVLWLVLPLGLLFQLPLIVAVLARMGVIDARSLAARRQYAVFGIFVAAAVLTPADVFSMLLLALPLWLLFEVSLLVARLAGAKARAGATNVGERTND